MQRGKSKVLLEAAGRSSTYTSAAENALWCLLLACCCLCSLLLCVALCWARLFVDHYAVYSAHIIHTILYIDFGILALLVHINMVNRDQFWILNQTTTYSILLYGIHFESSSQLLSHIRTTMTSSPNGRVLETISLFLSAKGLVLKGIFSRFSCNLMICVS